LAVGRLGFREMDAAEVPSDHEFFDPSYVRRWTQGTARKKPQRARFFDVFVTEISSLGRAVSVLELGSGPGALAEQLLRRCAVRAYYLVDFSPEMHALARERLTGHKNKTVYVEADFRDANWTARIPAAVNVIVSMQAIHELRNSQRAPELYRQAQSVLSRGGLVLVCDHVRPALDERPLFMSVHEHLAALRAAGVIDPVLLLRAGDLALFKGHVAKK
jgi:SAM-dependent methyltransferase